MFGSATIFNLSLLTSDIYSLLFGLFLFHFAVWIFSAFFATRASMTNLHCGSFRGFISWPLALSCWASSCTTSSRIPHWGKYEGAENSWIINDVGLSRTLLEIVVQSLIGRSA
jgi:hypothetical protein